MNDNYHKLKIAFLTCADCVHAGRWANAMAERGHDVSVITCANHMPIKIIYNKAVKIVSLKYKTPWGYFLNANQVKKIIRNEKFDIVNVHYAGGYGTLGRMARLKQALLNIWGSDVYDVPNENFIKRIIVKRNLNYFKYIASTSFCMAKEAKKLADRDYYITPFGVNTKLFYPRSEFKNENEFIFGTVKSLEAKYGIADTIKAFAKLYKRLVNEQEQIADKIFYRIYGEGSQREELQDLIKQCGMTQKITLCGFVENSKLPSVINGFDIFCCNSVMDSESFGVAAVEAMACGIPVIASDADGFKEVIEDGITGILVPKGDIDAIAESMYKLMHNDKLRKQMGQAGVQHVKKLYDWDNNVNNMEEIYYKMIEKKL